MEKNGERTGFWATAKRPFTLLLVSLLGTLAAYPVLEGFTWARLLLTVVLIFVMAAALFATRTHPKLFLAGVILACATTLAMVLAHFLDVSRAKPFATVLELLFMGVLAGAIFGDVLRRDRVTMDTVFGACCVYLMLALCWAGIYELIDQLSPGAFEYGGLSDAMGGADDSGSISRLAYFSIVTITTVGYGDVTPISAPARSFAALEGVVGQLYLAIVIARLVAMEMSNRMMGRS